MFCARCGQQIPEASETCPLCGREAVLKIEPQPPATYQPPALPDFSYSADRIQGVGGWLLFFCLSVLIFTPAIFFFQIAYLPHVLNGYRLLDTARVLFAFVLGIVLFMRRPIAIMLVRVYFGLTAANILMVFLSFVLAAVRTKNSHYISRGAVGVAPLMGYTILWFLYFHQSERVRNTYGSNA